MNKKSILIVEDETIIALNLKETLIDLGYTVFGMANNKCTTLEVLEQDVMPDLILMDIYLKGEVTGIELAKILHTTIPSVPVLFLTANSELSTIKKASTANAYGYLLKPIKEHELKANIEVALSKNKNDRKVQNKLNNVENINKTLERKLKESEENNIVLVAFKHGYIFDTHKKKLYFQDSLVELTAKEQELIYLLVKNRTGTISKEYIEHNLWPHTPPGEGAFRSLMFRIRKKLHKDLIINSNNIGYRLAVD